MGTTKSKVNPIHSRRTQPEDPTDPTDLVKVFMSWKPQGATEAEASSKYFIIKTGFATDF